MGEPILWVTVFTGEIPTAMSEQWEEEEEREEHHHPPRLAASSPAPARYTAEKATVRWFSSPPGPDGAAAALPRLSQQIREKGIELQLRET
jgi:hypothetical protein